MSIVIDAGSKPSVHSISCRCGGSLVGGVHNRRVGFSISEVGRRIAEVGLRPRAALCAVLMVVVAGCAGSVPVGAKAKYGSVTWAVGYKAPDFLTPNSDLGGFAK